MEKKNTLSKILKWAGILLLLIIILAISLPFVFKDKLISKVKIEANNSLNAKLNFGDFDLTLISSFPDFKFTLNNLCIEGIDSFAGDTLFAVKQMRLNINLMSVIKGEQYKINSIALDQPHIFAKVLKSGKANWDITKPSTGPATAAEPAKFKMQLKTLDIKNGKIIYDDASLGFLTILDGFNHSLSGDFTQDNFKLSTMSTIEKFTMAYGGVDYLYKVKVTAKADLDVDMPNFKFTFKENEFQLNELFLGLDGYFAMPKEDMDMNLKFSAKKSEFKNFLSLLPAVYTKDFASVKTTGKLALDGFVNGIYNDKRMPAFGAKILVEKAMFQYPSLPKAVNNINIDVEIDNKTGDPDHTVIDVNKFHVEIAGNPVDMKMHVSTPVSDANINGEITGRLDLTSVRDVIPMDKSDNLNGKITMDVKLKGRMSSIEKKQYEQFNASGQIAITDMNYQTKDMPAMAIHKMNLNFTPQFVELSVFDSKIGKSDMKANGKIENFLQYAIKGELLKGVFNVSASLLDINELMGPEKTTSPTAKDTAAMAVVAVPSNIDFVLSSDFKKVLYDNMEMTNMTGVVKVKDSKVDMSNLKFNMLEGEMIVNGSYDTKNIKKPIVDFALAINDFDLSKTYSTFNTIKKLAPVAKYCVGKFSTSLSFKSDLDTKMEPVLSTLSGAGKLQTKNVIISNFAPLVKLADAIKMDKYKKMELNNTNISFQFKDGKVNVEPFDVKLGNSNVNISGSNGFDQTINYKMAFDIPTAELGSAAGTVNSLLSKTGANMSLGDKIKLNALVGGTVTNPTVKIDAGSTVKNTVDNLKDKAKEELDKKKKELEDKARVEADRLKKEGEDRLNAEKDKAKAAIDKAKTEAEDKAKAEAARMKKQAEEKVKKEAENKLKGLFKIPK